MQPAKILIVEDEGIVALEIQNRLTNMGYKVIGLASTGEAAIFKATTLHPDLVLMDIRLKGPMDGITAAEQIRAQIDLPIIFLTAYADENTLQRAKITEPYNYVLKPFEERELHIAIEMALYKHQMERRVKTQEHWFSTTFNSINDALVTTDLNGQINFSNLVASNLLRWLPTQTAERAVDQVIKLADEATRRPLPHPVLVVLQSAQAAQLEGDALLLTAEADYIVNYRAAPIFDEQGERLGVVLALRDISRQRKLEADLLRAQRLEALGLMAGGIAHDFNNLLAAVVNNVALLKVHTENQAELNQRLEFVEKTLWRGSELAKQLLTFAKGGAPLRKPTVLSLVINEAAELALKDSGINLHFVPPTNLWLAEIDQGQMGQAFHNLFLNAREAMPNGGHVFVQAENCHLRPDAHTPLKPGRYLKVKILDQGSGIAPTVLDKIFDPYFTTKPTGSGLGLATTYSIVSRHEGLITVESTPGKGATFTLYVPAADPLAVVETPVAIDTAPSNGKGHILLMDDEEFIREATGAVLEHLGYTYEFASDGAQAVKIYQQAQQRGRTFDAVILDLTVPGGVGGSESIKELLAIDPQVKAIVSSGYSHDPIMANYRDYGFAGVVAKPFTIEEMSKTLNQLIQHTNRIASSGNR